MTEQSGRLLSKLIVLASDHLSTPAEAEVRVGFVRGMSIPASPSLHGNPRTGRSATLARADRSSDSAAHVPLGKSFADRELLSYPYHPERGALIRYW
jgi:hypothetical protein